ncbi:mariner Mos1 transposase [Trichonephila clavipes]|nr:mariner Mos1 transposase [Trichonephila clavipes]
MENRKVTCEMLLQRHEIKSFLYRIVTGDEKWIYFENPKRKNRSFHLIMSVIQQQGQKPLILLHDHAPSYTAKPLKETLKSLGWDILPNLLYSSDLAPSDYPLFASKRSTLAEQYFSHFGIGKWIEECFAAKDKRFFWWRGSCGRGICGHFETYYGICGHIFSPS